MKVRYDMINCYVVRPAATPGTHEFLQLRRVPGDDPMGGAWAVVRGGIEAEETAWKAALRELREETGLTPLEFYQVDTIDQFYLATADTLWHAPGFCALVDRDAKITLNDEHDAFRWVSRDRIDAEFLWPGERAQLAELCREILDDGPAKRFLRIAM